MVLATLTFTSDAVDVAELVATAAVALVRAIHVGTLLTAGVTLALIQIYTQSVTYHINNDTHISNTCVYTILYSVP